MATKVAYKVTGLAVLTLGVLFFLRDIGMNYIGETSGWTILLVLLGAGLAAGNSSSKSAKKGKAAV